MAETNSIDPRATGREFHDRTVARLLEEAASAVALVALLVDPTIPVIRLVTALASAGLAIRHDRRRDVLVLVCADDGAKGVAHG